MNRNTPARWKPYHDGLVQVLLTLGYLDSAIREALELDPAGAPDPEDWAPIADHLGCLLHANNVFGSLVASLAPVAVTADVDAELADDGQDDPAPLTRTKEPAVSPETRRAVAAQLPLKARRRAYLHSLTEAVLRLGDARQSLREALALDPDDDAAPDDWLSIREDLVGLYWSVKVGAPLLLCSAPAAVLRAVELDRGDDTPAADEDDEEADTPVVRAGR